MEKDKREYMTKEKITENVLKSYKKRAIVNAVVMPVVILLLVLLAQGCYMLTPAASFLWGIFLSIDACFCCVWAIGVIRLIREYRWIKRGEFYVEKDYARRIENGDAGILELLFLFTDWLWIPFWKKYIPGVYFKDNRRFGAHERDLDHAEPGDAFYLVVFRHRKQKIAGIYNAKFYRLEEV